jgi:DNA repair protein RadA/Sms
MSKARNTFVCQSCGAVSNRWQGKCDACGAWNSIVEEQAATGIGAATARKAPAKGRQIAFQSLAATGAEPPRTPIGIGELDRVTGGGLVPGSVILLGGEPGIGKSTLLIQACARLALAGGRVAYISGEEATAQVRMRAERLGLSGAPVRLAAATNVEEIVGTLSVERFDLVVIDSIQTMWTATIDAAPGTVSQVRGAAQWLIRYAKNTDACVILVGHVTKDGQIAGPRVVEHMVDAVMSFDGDAGHHFRILRALKNRFGPTDEIGVFEMTGRGLAEVGNPSAFFLSGRDATAAGTSVFAGMEGTRPLLVEMQALVAPTALGMPRRSVVGWNQNRLAMVIAVLETHAGVRLGQYDVYLNVAGGMRIVEPAADLAAAAALVSSITGKILPVDAVFFGEIGLSGSIRPVVHGGARMKEAAKLGFEAAVAPGTGSDDSAGLKVERSTHIADVVARIAALPGGRETRTREAADGRRGVTSRATALEAEEFG